MHASELMTTDVASVPPEATRQEIARLLVARGISAVPVVDSNGTPLGMVSEGDLIRRGEPERQQRRDWWLEMLAEGETLSEDYVRQLGGREAIARDLMSHLPDQHGGNDGRHESYTNFGVAKLGFGHSQSEIAHGGKSRAAGDCRAIYGGDRG